MPIYEYECADCGKIEEAVQKISDAPLTECGACSGTLHKIISQSAFHLKGGGWYSDLYSSQKPSGTSEGAGETAAKPAKPAESKTTGETKAAAKADA